jgi:L-lysine 2,3-aminomutase
LKFSCFFFRFLNIDLSNNNNNNHETFVDGNNHDKEQLQRYQQRISEKYWKEKQNRLSKLIFSNYLNNLLMIIDNQRLYTCRQCQRRKIEITDNESTFL